MTSNNLAPSETLATGESNDSPPRDHPITISVTAQEFAELKGMIPALEERLGRRTVPIGTAAYEVFRRGLELERAA